MVEIIYRKALMKTRRFRGMFGLSLSVILLISFFIVETSFLPSGFSFSQPSEVSSPVSPLPAQAKPEEFTYVDSETRSYAVFAGYGSFDLPVAMGRVQSDEEGTYLAPSLQIEALDDLYVLRDPREGGFLEVIEKLPQGGFGRVLRYRGKIEGGRSVDLEFIYEDQEKRITVLDHQAGRFYRTTLVEGKSDPSPFLFPLPEEKDFNFELTADSVSPQKFLNSLSKTHSILTAYETRLYPVSDISSEQNSWMSRLLRGPPAGGISL